MSFWSIAEKTLKVAGNVAGSAIKRNLELNYKKQQNTLVGSKTVNQWDSQWRTIGTLSDVELSPFNKSVGLYRARLQGRIVYIGRAIEYSNGGLRKRLSDYRRKSNSGRTHGSGQKMNANNAELKIEVLITGGDSEAAGIAKKLEPLMVGKHQPEWNVQFM
jgi:hypothetical protein